MTGPVHILSLPENLVGSDYVMGDIHGSSTLFRSVINLLGPRDRLFIAGDLFDRGENSLDVFHALMEMKRRRRHVYAVRGNHEDFFLKAHDFFRKKNLSIRSDVIGFFRQGGAWIFKDPELQCVAKNSGKTMDESTLDQLIDAVSNKSGALVDEFDQIAAYLKTLPFIISVGKPSSLEEKKRAFFVCHADMPISDGEVYARLFENNDPFLSDQEQHYVMWARENGGDPCLHSNLRVIASVIAYVGHSIYGEKINSVRRLTNTINLDGGAYYYGVSVVVNHTKSTVAFFSASERRIVEPYHTKRCNELLDFYFERRIKRYSTWSLILENEFSEIKSFLLRQYDYYLMLQNNLEILSFLFFWKKTIDPALLSVIQKMIESLRNITTKESIGNIVIASAKEIKKVLIVDLNNYLVTTHPISANNAARDLLLGCYKVFDLCARGSLPERLPTRRARDFA